MSSAESLQEVNVSEEIKAMLLTFSEFPEINYYSFDLGKVVKEPGIFIASERKGNSFGVTSDWILRPDGFFNHKIKAKVGLGGHINTFPTLEWSIEAVESEYVSFKRVILSAISDMNNDKNIMEAQRLASDG